MLSVFVLEVVLVMVVCVVCVICEGAGSCICLHTRRARTGHQCLPLCSLSYCLRQDL